MSLCSSFFSSYLIDRLFGQSVGWPIECKSYNKYNTDNSSDISTHETMFYRISKHQKQRTADFCGLRSGRINSVLVLTEFCRLNERNPLPLGSLSTGLPDCVCEVTARPI